MDVLFCSFNRKEMTIASLTQLHHVTRRAQIVCFDDGSTDGTADWVRDFCHQHRIAWRRRLEDDRMGGPVAIMNWWLSQPGAPLFAKIDNDVILPTGWLEAAERVMVAHPELDILGLEPPQSRTCAPWRAQEEHDRLDVPESSFAGGLEGFAPAHSVGGVAVIRRSAFYGKPEMRQVRIYGGFYHWQLQHASVLKGWIVPPLKLFLLDRVPVEPWLSLSVEYIRKGWQRPWTNYDLRDRALWEWFTSPRPASL